MTEEENEHFDERVAIVIDGDGCSYALAQKIANYQIYRLQKNRIDNLIAASKGVFK